MTTKTGKPLDRDVLESLLKRRLFFTPAFEIHAPVKGLFGKMVESLHFYVLII
jgi:glycyl-tRNA synthetase